MTLFYGIVTQRYTRNLILRGLCIVYLASFLSIYIQAPGLYGDNGILPARAKLENCKYKNLTDRISDSPTLLWLAPYVGLSTSAAIDVLALLGAFMAFTGIVSQKFCIVPWFVGLYSLNYSLNLVGQAFIEKTYDDLLLEAGFIAMVLAPPAPSRSKKFNYLAEWGNIWLCRWLVFRYLFSSGLGKLMSGCPKWWSLTALQYQFEVMPLPNPLSWYAHQIPSQYLKYSTAFASACELFFPLMFFFPSRLIRIAMFRFEIFLQFCILATGNFEHSNVLLIVLLFSLLDDEYFHLGRKPRQHWRYYVDTAVGSFLLLALLTVLYCFYHIGYYDGIVDVYLPEKQLVYDFVEKYLYLITVCGFALCMAIQIIVGLYHLYKNLESKETMHLVALPSIFLAYYIFVNSQITIHQLHPKTNATFPPEFKASYPRLHRAHIINEYNLFPRMTGTDGRPEIILEGANDLEGPWKEYSFLYKPGNVNNSLSFIAPYAPKLDWQMYWAARSTAEKTPWLLSFTHRLLLGVPEVLSLIDRKHSPFSDKPPKYIRGVLYKYKFTYLSQSTNAWWVREKVGDYFPPYTKDSPALEDYLRARNLLPLSQPQEIHPIWEQILKATRTLISGFDGPVLFWTILFVAITILVSTSVRR